MPPCVPVCPGNLPKAPQSTDLGLKYVIPKSNQSQKIDYAEYLAENKYKLFCGDRLVYVCNSTNYGVYGGEDTEHDSFE